MNAAQKLYLSAKEAAEQTAGLDLSAHELANKELELFGSQDPADFAQWKSYFTAKRTLLRDMLVSDAGTLASLAAVKTASELKPKPAAVPAKEEK